jgi:hypothetical protein
MQMQLLAMISKTGRSGCKRPLQTLPHTRHRGLHDDDEHLDRVITTPLLHFVIILLIMHDIIIQT